jgi:hypothetical protein
MGQGDWKKDKFQAQAQEAVKSENSGFTATRMCDDFNPALVKKEGRWSKTGPFNDFRDPITVLCGLDVTGSMGLISKLLLTGGLGTLMEYLKVKFNRPNENIQMSFAGIGDVMSDSAPLQVTHFESDIRFALWLQKIWLEGNGGGNGAESYNLLWLYAAMLTHLNYVRQTGRKGILITIGDDNVHPELTANEIQMWLRPDYQGGTLTNREILLAVREQYEVYHIVITDGDSYDFDFKERIDKTDAQKAAEAKKWRDLLGENNVVDCKSNEVVNAIGQIITRHRPPQRADMSNLSDEEWVKKTRANLTDEQWVEVLNYCLCPLSRVFMTDPVTWSEHKRGFQKEAVERYVRENQLDPITKRKTSLLALNFKPNTNIAQLCLNYKPYFDALPIGRKEHLIQMTLSSQLQAEHQKVKGSGVVQAGMFSKSFPVPPSAVSPLLPAAVSSAPSSLPSAVPPAAASPVPPKAPAPVPPDLSAVLNLDSDKTPYIFLCSVNQTVLKDGVLAADGYPYERAVIEKWFEKHDTSPMTGAVINKTLIPLNFLRSDIERWEEFTAKYAVPAASLGSQPPQSAVPAAAGGKQEDVSVASVNSMKP